MTREQSAAKHPAARALFAAERLTGYADLMRVEADRLAEQAGVAHLNADSMSNVDPIKDHERAYGYALAELARLRRHQADVVDGTAEHVRSDDAGRIDTETAVVGALIAVSVSALPFIAWLVG
jgi:N-acetyl-anhydromuramyl-L-alanine amidase AmpD